VSENPADKILGQDWHPPLRDLMAQEWAKLEPPERERLQELHSERDENGDLTWVEHIEPDPDDSEFELLMLRPVDQWDPRREYVGRWLVKARAVPEEHARAVVEEHRADD
jgi:hypothetical protein